MISMGWAYVIGGGGGCMPYVRCVLGKRPLGGLSQDPKFQCKAPHKNAFYFIDIPDIAWHAKVMRTHRIAEGEHGAKGKHLAPAVKCRNFPGGFHAGADDG